MTKELSDLCERVTLPCSTCGEPAASIDLRQAASRIPAANLIAAKGAARIAGQRLDLADPCLGIAAADASSLLMLRCLSCTGQAVDNNLRSANGTDD